MLKMHAAETLESVTKCKHRRTQEHRMSRVWRGIGVIVVTLIVSGAVVPASADSIDAVLARIGGETQLIEGLKDALKVGTENAVDLVSQPDGFYANDLIKIALPDHLQEVATLLKNAGLGEVVAQFELSMNRAAEDAASSATVLFVDAITDMTFDDAVAIFTGEDTAATQYFQDHMTDPLTTEFTPIIETAMAEVGVTRLYQEFETAVTQIMPLGLGDLFKVDLSQYVTEKALEGLFTMVAEEEKKIREDPEARVTELLEQLFQ